MTIAWLVYCSICDVIRIVNACIGFLVLLSNNLTDDLLSMCSLFSSSTFIVLAATLRLNRFILS